MQSAENHIAFIEDVRDRFESALLAHVENASKGENAEIMALAREVLMAGGKRWRPILLLLDANEKRAQFLYTGALSDSLYIQCLSIST